MESSLLVDSLSAFAADSHAARFTACHVVYMMRYPHGLVAAGAYDHYIRSRKGALALRDSTLNLLGWIGPRMALDHHGVFHQDPACRPVHAQHAPGLALVAAGDHLDGIFLLQVDTNRFRQFLLCDCHQITSGASETIFMNFLSRSSLATGPNTRVPTGSPTSLINTAALESKRMYVPS